MTRGLPYILALLLAPAAALAAQLGDLDGDGVATVRDLAILVGHKNETRTLPAAQAVLADVNGDGAVNQADADEVVFEILGTRTPQELPFATLRSVSPSDGEGDVALTRETILHFSLPLNLGASISTNQFFAEFGGKRLLSRAELSSDRKKATLFYLQPLPSSARVNVWFDGTGLTDLLGRPLDADGDGVTGGVARVQFDTLSITPVAQTGIRGRVFASERATGGLEVPLAGVTVTVDGAEETLRTTTDAQGNFTLTPCPAGSFFVHVDGRTSPQSSYPGGNYYPSVGKRWHAEPGRADNLAGNEQDVTRGDIYLPLIKAGTLAATSPTEDVTITNPDLPGAYLIVPANSLFSDDGARGGSVGMAPVAPDRIPSPLPPGLNLPLVVTIQTSGGQNFDRPVPLCLPNLPNPVTGEKLPPGAASALWSFNHDLGDWEVVGPMTVTADGEFVKTDVGIGVRQPGWHGTQPGCQITAPAPTAPPPKQPCPEKSAWEYAELVYDVMSQAAKCASGFGNVNKAISCALKFIDSSITITREVMQLIQTLKDGGTTCQRVMASISLLKAQKDRVIELLDCFNQVSPLSKLKAAAACIGSALEAAESICGFLGVGDNDQPPECLPSPTTKKICKGLEAAKILFDQVISLLSYVEDLQQKLGGAAIKLAFDELDILARSICLANGARPALAGAPSEGDKLSPEEIAQLKAAAEKFEKEVGILQKSFETNDALISTFIELESGVQQLSKDASDAIREIGASQHGSHYFMINMPNLRMRGRTTVMGTASFILPPDTVYEYSLLDEKGIRMGTYTGISPANGGASIIGSIFLRAIPGENDPDEDGLSSFPEEIVGTDSSNSDTDGDLISDGAEVRQGTNPLNGMIVSTGVIASAPTSGQAVDVSAVNNLAAVACQTKGVTLFNIFSGLNPVRIAEIPVVGSAVAVSCAGNYVAVACLYGGLAVIDISDPRNPRLAHQTNFGASAEALTTDGLVAYIGLDNGQVAAVDLATGKVLARTAVPGSAVEDVAIGPGHLYVLKLGGLYTMPIIGTIFGTSATTPFSGTRGAGGHRLRLSLGEDLLYAVHTAGVQMYSIVNPGAPVYLRDARDGQFGWKSFSPTGSGAALVASGANSTNDGQHDVQLYDLAPSGTNLAFLTRFPTPGLAAAATIYNGLGYVADSAAGLQVVNYRPFDTQGQPPSISLGSNVTLNHTAHTGMVEEGKAMRLYATVSDDVQVRNVEFHIDGALANIDGNYPFEHRFITPALSPTNSTFTVRAKTTDTGGNTAWTDIYSIALTPDATPPTVLGVSPANGAFVGAISNLFVTFNEPMDHSTLAAGLQLMGVNGTASPARAIYSYRENVRVAIMGFPASLPPGQYQIRAATPLADAAGNPMASPYISAFRVYSFTDNDVDGVPDELETQLGLQTGDNDSDNDGVLDGDEDYDGDRLSNRGEVALQRDPKTRDSDGNGIWDGDEDGDMDGLNDGGETSAGTDSNKADSDGDGFDDSGEVQSGTDPLNPQSVPLPAVSKAISYLLPVIEQYPSGLIHEIASPTINFYNAIFDNLPTGMPFPILSPPVSFQNP